MANIKSINGNPIVVDASGIENGAITGQKINDVLVKENRYGFDIDSIGLTKGHYLDKSTGKPVANNDHWVSDFISVSEGMKFGYALAGGSVVSLLCEYSSDETFVRSVLTGAGYGTPVTGTYTVPSGVGYIRVCTLNYESDENCAVYHFYGIAFVLIGSQKALVESLSSQIDMFTDEEYLQHLEYKHMATIDSSGQIHRTGLPYHHLTGFIPVPTGSVLQYSMVLTAGFNLISAYDDGFNFVEAVAVGQGANSLAQAVTGTYVVPDGVSYIRVSIVYNDTVPLSGQYLRSISHGEKNVESLSKREELFSSIVSAKLEMENMEFVAPHFIRASDGLYTTLSATAGGMATPDYIPVMEGMVVDYELACSAGFAIYATYDSDKKFVSSVEGSGWANQISGSYTVPSGVSYMRFSRLPPSQYPNQYIKIHIPILDDYYRYDGQWGINERNDDAIQAIQHSRRYRFSNADSGDAPLTLLHFTDIHGTQDALERIVEFRDENADYIDDAVCTGDMVAASIAYKGMDFWDAVDGAESILMTIGNHDLVSSTTGNATVATLAEQYEMYIGKYSNNWGNASTVNDKTWWYKDYNSQKIRLIGLGSSYTMGPSDLADEIQWLSNTLTAAKSLDYSVIVAQHYLPSDVVYVDCNFTQTYGRSDGVQHIDNGLMDVIQEFINDGGKFVCHLCGHTHQDLIAYSSSYKDQYFICGTTSSSYSLQQQFGDQARVKNTKSIDAFNVITFDTNRSQLKIIRVGADRDMIMRSRKVLCMNYDTKTIVYQG